MRSALGVSSGRVVRLLLSEALVIAVAAATLGFGIAAVGFEVVCCFGVGYLLWV